MKKNIEKVNSLLSCEDRFMYNVNPWPISVQNIYNIHGYSFLLKKKKNVLMNQINFIVLLI